jgi:hypothetical protein
MSVNVPPSSLPKPIDQLRIRMIRELEAFLSATVTRSGPRLIPTARSNSHASQRSWYHNPVPSIAGEKTSC